MASKRGRADARAKHDAAPVLVLTVDMASISAIQISVEGEHFTQEQCVGHAVVKIRRPRALAQAKTLADRIFFDVSDDLKGAQHEVVGVAGGRRRSKGIAA